RIRPEKLDRLVFRHLPAGPAEQALEQLTRLAAAPDVRRKRAPAHDDLESAQQVDLDGGLLRDDWRTSRRGRSHRPLPYGPRQRAWSAHHTEFAVQASD